MGVGGGGEYPLEHCCSQAKQDTKSHPTLDLPYVDCVSAESAEHEENDERRNSTAEEHASAGAMRLCACVRYWPFLAEYMHSVFFGQRA